MRYIALVTVIILVACTVPPPNVPKPETAQGPAPIVAPVAWPVTLPAVEVAAPRAKAVKPPKPDDVIEHNPCAGITGEDVKEDINLKLDCMLNLTK